MDLSHSIEPNSQQVNAEDFISGPMTVTIETVESGNSEQPVFVHLAEFPGRTYRPSKSMRRVMVAAWGADASIYAGRRMTLYRDPEVRFGSEAVGGIKISHLSHIDKPMKLALTVTRGRRAQHSVQPLADGPVQRDWSADVAACSTEDELRMLWERSDKGARVSVLIKARKAELAAPEPQPEPEVDGPMFAEAER